MASIFRYELLPFASAEKEVAAAPGPLLLTITCSPKHGPDQTVELAAKFAELGHTVVPHIAARMVSGTGHLDELLARLREAGIDELFVVGGDAAEPAGRYRSGLQLIEDIRAHTDAPHTIGVPAYPEGHPLIDGATLWRDLRAKDTLADYAVTQMCFDSDRLLSWLGEVREAGLGLPVYLGLPGSVDRKRLVEVALKVGVGPSLSYLRKNRGASLMLARGGLAKQMLDELIPVLDSELGVAGFHWFTFNQLTATAAIARRHERQQLTPAR